MGLVFNPFTGTFDVTGSSGGGGGTISGTIAATQVAFGTAPDTIGGDGNLLWDGTTFQVGPTTSVDQEGLVTFATVANIAFTTGESYVGSAYLGIRVTPTVDNIVIDGLFTRAEINSDSTRPVSILQGLEEYVSNRGSGVLSDLRGAWRRVQTLTGATTTRQYGEYLQTLNIGTVGTNYGFYVNTPTMFGGTIATNIAFYAAGQTGTGITNVYPFWSDERGVAVLKAVTDFDAVSQANWRIYNPLFTQYTPGTTDREYVVAGQWTGNVAEIGTVATGTGTLRGLNLIGATVKVNGSIVIVTGGALGTPSSGTLTNCAGLTEAGLSLSDVTTANVSATAHGFAPKFPNNTTTFLRGDGTYAVPPAGTGTVTSVAASVPAFLSISGSPITTSGTLAISYSGTALPVANGGTAATSASITAFNNITGYSASGATGTTSTNLVFSTSPSFTTPILGTPQSGDLSNCTALPIGSITGLGTGIATWLATPSSANLASAITDETGSGALVFGTAPTFTTSAIINEAVGSSALTLTGAIQTVSHPALSITQTWNAGAQVFKGVVVNVTKTAADAASAILSLEVAGSPKFAIGASGEVLNTFLVGKAGSQFSIQCLNGTNAATQLARDSPFGWTSSSGDATGTLDTILRRAAPAVVQCGSDVNGAAVSQTVQAANGITGTDKTGGSLTVASGKGTGAGAVSQVLIQTPTVLGSGTTAQSLATRVTIDSSGLQATGYKSSDGTAGATAGPFTTITSITVKNGLITALTGA